MTLSTSLANPNIVESNQKYLMIQEHFSNKIQHFQTKLTYASQHSVEDRRLKFHFWYSEFFESDGDGEELFFCE